MFISQTKTSPYIKWYAVTLSFIFEKTILKNYPEGDLAKCKNATELLSRVFEHLSSVQFC